MTNFYVDDKTISDRAALLLGLARKLLADGVIPADQVDLAEHRFQQISEGYFLLNKAYKDWRMPDGHFTEHAKIGALQAVVISRLQPFFPKTLPVDDMNISVIKCNEIFALSYALGILERDFKPDAPEKVDFWLRTLDIITASSAETIEPYIVDRKYQIPRRLVDYDVATQAVHKRDQLAINSLICIFELISGKSAKILG